uniref:Uncharacterized protein n=1 Tax=Drosophila melanogaster TaxID=7227 RepID=Q6AHR8_DROME|nr:unknown [Drosophila melanogaster]
MYVICMYMSQII